MSDDLIERYKKLASDVQKLEAALEATRAQRGVVAGQLLARDGKGRGYDLGDGVEQIVCSTKVGTHYLVARNKWIKQGRLAAAKPKVTKPPKEPKAVREPKAAKLPKVAVKRAIVNGKIVEVPQEPKRASERPSAIDSEPEALAPAEAIESEPLPEPQQVLETSVAPEAPVQAAGAEPQRVVETPPAVAPVAVPEPSPAEVDPLDAALAALDM